MKSKIFKTKLDDYRIDNRALVSIKEMGNIYEICYKQKRNNCITIKLLDKDTYIDLTTGEVKKCNHIDNRSENTFQVGQTLKRLRDYINTNVTIPSNWKWLTLTYRENMTDTRRLYEDFKRFITRLRRAFTEYHLEYIVAMEPQGRGAWHCHLLLDFGTTAPFIDNSIIEKLWEQGFTKTKKLDSKVDNIGAYLTAYLGDIELTEETQKELQQQHLSINDFQIKEVDNIEGIELKETKKFIKGARLYLYPPNFNIYRISRGIKKPKKEVMKYISAKRKIGHLRPTYKTTYSITDNKDYSDIISYEYYNTKRVITQTEVDSNPPDRKEHILNYSKELNSIKSMLPTPDEPLNIIMQELDGTCEMHGQVFKNWEECQKYIEDRGIKKYLKIDIVEPFFIEENR